MCLLNGATAVMWFRVDLKKSSGQEHENRFMHLHILKLNLDSTHTKPYQSDSPRPEHAQLAAPFAKIE